MLFTEARKHEVVSTNTARKVGLVDALVVDLGPPRVRLLRLRKTDTDGELLDWADLEAFGADAVTVESEGLIHSPRDDWERAALGGDADILGRTVLTERGDRLGTVSDVEFDPETGAVSHLVVDDHIVDGIRMLGHGDYAVVVSEP